MDAPATPVVKQWRYENTTEIRRRRGVRLRSFRIGVTLAAIALVLACLGAVLSWLHPAPNPTFIFLGTADYDADELRFANLEARPRQHLPAPADAPLAVVDRAAVLAALDQAGKLTARDCLILYVSGHAVCAADGSVHLLASDARLDAPETWVPLRIVLEKLRDSACRRKLLVLDIAQPLGAGRLATLADETADAVEHELAAVKDSDRLVLCAHAPGQSGYTSPELQGTVFAHYFTVGLRGQADGCRDGQPDGLVTVKELASYVAGQVERWVRHNRGLRQTPVLAGAAADFAVAALPATPLSPYIGVAENVAGLHLPALKSTAPQRRVVKYPEWLAAAWRRRDGWIADAGYRTLPHLFQQHQALLLAAEQCAASADAEECERRFLPRLSVIEKALGDCRRSLQTAPVSLVQASEQGGKSDATVTAAVQDILGRWREQAVAMSSADTVRLRERLVGEFTARTQDCSNFALAAAVFQHVAAATPAELALFDAMLMRPAQRQPQFVETVLLRQLVSRSDLTDQNVDIIRHALQACVKCQRLIGSADVFPWTAPLINDAMQLYHDAEVRLAAGGYASLASAEELFAQAEKSCDELLDPVERITQARSVLDQALLLIPSYPPYLDVAPELQETWEEAVLATRDLHKLLHARLEAAEKTAPAELWTSLKDSAAALGSQAQKVSALLERLRQPFSHDRCVELAARGESPTADAVVYNQLAALLAVAHPHMSAGDRVALWETNRKLGQRLHDQTAAAKFAAESIDAGSVTARMNVDRSFRRARSAIALLELISVDHAGLQSVVDSLNDIDGRPKSPCWAGLSNVLRDLWNKRLNDYLTGACSPEAAELTLWAMPAFAWDAAACRIDKCVTYTAALARHEKLRSWQGQHFRYVGRDYAGLGLSTPAVASAVAFWNQVVTHYPESREAGGMADLEAKIVGVDLRNPTSEARLKVRRTPHDGKAAPLSVEVLDPDSKWFEIAPRRLSLPETRSPENAVVEDELALNVSMNAAAGIRQQPAAGFLLRVGYAERFYHHAVPTPFTAGGKVQITLCADPNKPVPMRTISITPGGDNVCYLVASNPFSTPRKAWIEIGDGGTIVKRLQVELDPFELKKLTWKGAEKPAPFVGPLTLRTLDQDGKRVVDVQEVAVALDGFSALGVPPSLKLALPRPKQSADKVACKVVADNAPPDAALEVRLERPAGYQTDAVDMNEAPENELLGRFASAKNVRLELKLGGGDGALSFAASVRDWSVDIDTSLLTGQYLVRARLLDQAGNTLGEAIDNLRIAERRVRIIEAPERAMQGTAIEMKALAADSKASVASVQFFVGAPEAGRIPPRTTLLVARPVNNTKTHWSAHLKLPEDRKGPTPITVAVTNGAGETSFDTVQIDVAEGERSPLGRIEGRVTEGSRPQPGLTVQLLDEAGREVDRTTTSPDGVYTFRNLPPGRYQVHCNKPASRRRAQLAVIVEANKKSNAPLPLGL